MSLSQTMGCKTDMCNSKQGESLNHPYCVYCNVNSALSDLTAGLIFV